MRLEALIFVVQAWYDWGGEGKSCSQLYPHICGRLPRFVITFAFMTRFKFTFVFTFMIAFTFKITFAFILMIRRGRQWVEVAGGGSQLQRRFTPTSSLPWMRFFHHIKILSYQLDLIVRRSPPRHSPLPTFTTPHVKCDIHRPWRSSPPTFTTPDVHHPTTHFLKCDFGHRVGECMYAF